MTGSVYLIHGDYSQYQNTESTLFNWLWNINSKLNIPILVLEIWSGSLTGIDPIPLANQVSIVPVGCALLQQQYKDVKKVYLANIWSTCSIFSSLAAIVIVQTNLHNPSVSIWAEEKLNSLFTCRLVLWGVACTLLLLLLLLLFAYYPFKNSEVVRYVFSVSIIAYYTIFSIRCLVCQVLASRPRGESSSKVDRSSVL